MLKRDVLLVPALIAGRMGLEKSGSVRQEAAEELNRIRLDCSGESGSVRQEGGKSITEADPRRLFWPDTLYHVRAESAQPEILDISGNSASAVQV